MGDWNRLGIEATDDLKIVKRAYVRKLKEHHPEEDPQGFQSLQEAYNRIVRRIEGRTVIGNHSVQMRNEKKTQSEKAEAVRERGCEQREGEFGREEELTVLFMRRVSEIWEDQNRRNNAESWRRLLDEECFWTLTVRENLNDCLLDFFLDKWRNEPHELQAEVIRIFDEQFCWSEQNRRLGLLYPVAFLDSIVEKSGRLTLKAKEADSSFYSAIKSKIAPVFKMKKLIIWLLILAGIKGIFIVSVIVATMLFLLAVKWLVFLSIKCYRKYRER